MENKIILNKYILPKINVIIDCEINQKFNVLNYRTTKNTSHPSLFDPLTLALSILI